MALGKGLGARILPDRRVRTHPTHVRGPLFEASSIIRRRTTVRSLPLLICLLALQALLAGHPVAAQTNQLDLAVYEQFLRAARTAAARGDRLDLEQVAPELIGARAVRMPSGELAPVDNRWLAEALAPANPDLPAIAARLGALIDALAAPPGGPPDDAQARLAEILARPPFATTPEPREPGWLERFFIWLTELLEGLVVPVGEAAAGPSGTTASWIVTALGAALIIGVLAVSLRGLRRSLRPVAVLPSAAAVAHSAADARAQAEALARSGDYRSAVRLLAIAALLWLDERGTLRYDPHQTNREHLARLDGQPHLRERLRPVVETADRVWYGGAPLDDHGYREYLRRVEDLRNEEAP